MKEIIRISLISLLFAGAFTACQQSYTTYDDAEYIMFADSVSVNMVLADQDWFNIPVVATTKTSYPRTFGVEVIDKGSNAVEGRHFRLKSNTITIPAGELTANVEVHGVYENIEPADSLGFTLKLVLPESVKWNGLYTDETKVTMYKSCPFVIEEFTGWCVVTSLFLNELPGAENRSYQRLVWTEKDPSKENTVIMRNWLFTGYDVSITFNPENPAEPLITMDEGQVISDEMSVFGIAYGDNKIRVDASPYSISSFNACQRFVTLWILAYVEDLGELYGNVGEFINVMEWVSDEEADRLAKEDGLIKRY